MFSKLCSDLDSLNKKFQEEQDAGCQPGHSKVFFETMMYMRHQNKFKLILFYVFTFVKSRGKEYRQCYLPLKLSYTMFAYCYFKISLNRIRNLLGI